MNFKSFLNEDFKSAKAKWVADNFADAEVEKYIKLFRALKDSSRIKSPENDIGIWEKKSFKVFKEFVDKHEEIKKGREQSKENKSKADVVFENDKCTVYMPKTLEASQRLGTGTKWCISARSEEGCRNWDDYVEINGVTPYYIIPKVEVEPKYKKIAVIILPNKFGSHVIHSVWSADNKAMYDMNGKEGSGELSDVDWVWEDFGINKNIFKTINTFKGRYGIVSTTPEKTIHEDGKTYELYRIKASQDFGDVSEGDLGGLIWNTNNIGKGNCWVYDDAMVYGNGYISGNAQIKGRAKVHGNAKVSGDSVISGTADICGNARIVDRNITSGKVER